MWAIGVNTSVHQYAFRIRKEMPLEMCYVHIRYTEQDGEVSLR